MFVLKFIEHIIRSTTWQFGTNFNCFPSDSRCLVLRADTSSSVSSSPLSDIYCLNSIRETIRMHASHRCVRTNAHPLRLLADQQKTTVPFLCENVVICLNCSQIVDKWRTMCLLHHWAIDGIAVVTNKSLAWPFVPQQDLWLFQWRRTSNNI